MRYPKWVGGSLNFQFNEIINVFPGGSIPCSGTKTSRLAEHKLSGIGGKNFASESLVVIVNGTTQFQPLILRLVNPDRGRNNTNILDTEL